MDAFLAFLEHVHSSLTTTYHNTPIMLMASPQWTRPDCEAIARYIFEKTKTPALCLINSAVATQYGLKVANMTVVDIGFEKVDVTCIYDHRIVNHVELGFPNPDRAISGGEVFTQSLLRLLEKKGFNYDMAEQLKKSNICEVLPYEPDAPKLMELPEETPAAGASGATTGAAASDKQGTDAPKIVEPPRSVPPVSITALDGGPADDGLDDDKAVENDGVLDVASIVASGQTKEFLAKKEREKAEKRGRGRKQPQEEQPARAVRLPNSKRVTNVFHYEEVVEVEVVPEPPAAAQKPESAASAAAPATAPAPDAEQKPAEPAEPADTVMEDAAPAPAAAPEGEPAAAEAKQEKAEEAEEPKAANGAEAKDETEAKGESETAKAAEGTSADAPAPPSEPSKLLDDPPTVSTLAITDPAQPPQSALPPPPPERQLKRVRRDVEVGLERFTFADRYEIDRIVTAIYRAVQGIDDMYMRPACWENIVFVGNGSRIRGLRDNIMQTLNARHLVSPSTATMFTSELPSNMATPSGTGAQTPTGAFTNPPHQLGPSSGSGVNPLLQAATTASLGIPSAIAARGAAGGDAGTPGGAATPSGPASNAGEASAAGAAAAAAAGHSAHFHSQTPTAIKLLPLPTYLGEWTKNGFEEAMFLGAQVAARIAFCMHNLDAQGVEAQRLMSLGRIDYK